MKISTATILSALCLLTLNTMFAFDPKTSSPDQLKNMIAKLNQDSLSLAKNIDDISTRRAKAHGLPPVHTKLTELAEATKEINDLLREQLEDAQELQNVEHKNRPRK